jgi:hypothetical protein
MEGPGRDDDEIAIAELVFQRLNQEVGQAAAGPFEEGRGSLETRS